MDVARHAYISLGANLPSPRYGPPVATCRAAVSAMEERGLTVIRRSRWYRSRPVPPSDQPLFVNGVVAVSTVLPATTLLALLHDIETTFGRVRTQPNAARILDLDLIACGDAVLDVQDGIRIPHPRMHERAFVLRPLAEIAPDWRHPQLGIGIGDLIARLSPDQDAEPLASD